MSFFYNKYVKAVFVIALFMIGFISARAEQLPMKKYCYPQGENYFETMGLGVENLLPVKSKERVQADNFVTFDSLANMYSYLFLMANRPFAYDNNSGNLFLVKRGFFDPNNPLHSGYQGSNWTYNIYMRYSKDYATTWEPEVLIYDKAPFGYFDARYPTCYGFQMNDKQYVAHTFPVIQYLPPPASSEWHGFLSMLWDTDITDITAMPMAPNNEGGNYDFVFESKQYRLSTDSRLVAGEKPDAPGEYYFVSANEVSSVDRLDFPNASHIALRYSELIDQEVSVTVPDAWHSNKFNTVDREGSRFNQLIDLRIAEDGVMYMAAYGNFMINGTPSAANTIGVSKSTDYGLTWQPFDICPDGLTTTYAMNAGFADGRFIYGYNTKSFIAFNGGDFSFIINGNIFSEIDTVSKIVEIYKEDGNWGIREIADHSGLSFIYQDVFSDAEQTQRTNPSGVELQATRTADGSHIIAKWIELEGITGGQFETSDVYMAARAKNSNKWSNAVNVTQSEEIDKTVWIPDFVKDKNSIPMIKCYSYPRDGSDERTSQFYAAGLQYVKSAVATPDFILDVEDNILSENINMDVVPNPVSDIARVRVFYEGEPVQTEVAIFTLLGEKVAVVSNDIMSYGTHHFDYNVSTWVAGTYYVVVSVGDKKFTKLMNIIK